MIKKYALISTSHYDAGDWKSFYVLAGGLTEYDVTRIKYFSDEFSRLWKECYEQERENAKNGVSKDLRTSLNELLNKRISDKAIYTITDYHKLWTEKDLIIEHYEL